MGFSPSLFNFVMSSMGSNIRASTIERAIGNGHRLCGFGTARLSLNVVNLDSILL